MGLPWSSGEESAFQWRGRGFSPWSGTLRSHVPQGNQAQEPQLLILRVATRREALSCRKIPCAATKT